jgi:hypothetical protein
MNNDTDQRIQEIQTRMMESARSCFPESALGDLHYLIRRTGEFFHYVQTVGKNPQNEFDRRYTMESVFSGVDSFCVVSASYRVLVGATRSAIDWEKISVPLFNEQFISKFNDFLTESSFEKQCRLLLDLFKFQIILASMSYD